MVSNVVPPVYVHPQIPPLGCSTTSCSAVAGDARWRQSRPSKSMDKLPNSRRHKRSSGDNPTQSDQTGDVPACTQSRTMLSLRDEAIKSGSESGGVSHRWPHPGGWQPPMFRPITLEVSLYPLNPPLPTQRKVGLPDPM